MTPYRNGGFLTWAFVIEAVGVVLAGLVITLRP